MTERARSAAGAEVEKELVCLFSKLLQRQTSARYARPLLLDVQGQKASADGQPDFLLKGKSCADVVVELKRAMTNDISAEKRAEKQIREAVREALKPADESLCAGCTLVLWSALPCVSRRERWPEQFLCELRSAFERATFNEPHESCGQPSFELWRTPPGDQPLAVYAKTLKLKRREFMRLVKNADDKRGFAGQLPAGAEYILLLLADGIGDLTCTEVVSWFDQQRILGEWQPHRVSRIYLTEVSCDIVPRLCVYGLWPRSNGLSENIRISRRRAVRFIQYAHGRLRALSGTARGAVRAI